MPEKILMLALSPTMESGTLARWRKREGESIASGDVLCEVETDKATMDYESSWEGTLLKILVPEGGQAKVGDPIAIVGKPGEDISGLIAEGTKTAAPLRPLVSKPVSSADSAVRRAPAPVSGRIKSSPLARRIAQGGRIELQSIKGSGPEGRIVKRDVESVLTTLDSISTGGQGAQTLSPAPLLQPGPGDEVKVISRMRQVIARRLSESMYTAPHYYLTVAVGMDVLLATRARLDAGREKKTSVNAFLIALAARALARHPQVNSSWNGKTLLQHSTADIGLAVALPEGLITPVVRDCGHKGITTIDSELADLILRAKAGKLAPREYEGATFTLSNLGHAGIDEFTAIINPPGSAILAIGAIRKEPVVENDAVVVRQRMRITLSCDHRIIDGAVGAAFLRELADMLENPLLALA
jgi:pyruvate dehydrogenase E2 component (dihydrolipoamide acetyltransferase)